uniref:Replication factor C (RfcS) n=1 Tax=uncultured marine thaumarchaeote SAT1000_04_F07 TaxID=1456355 RepID=A0A075I3T3_9ARCH|nr:replication factor C (rfcS) [uncultured marine thaumarchaeote SAT1000_04_F07]
MLKNQSEMPHLLFSGSAGVGKTSAALCLSKEILGEHSKDYTLELNASDERGINMVRERVKNFHGLRD